MKLKYAINEYDYIVPIGSNCRIANALRDKGLRKEALPLDWTLTSTKAVFEGFQGEFKNLLTEQTCVEQDLFNYPHVLNHELNINITHEKRIDDSSKKKYERKVSRLKAILGHEQAKVLFIRNHADGEWINHDLIHRDYNNKEQQAGIDPLDTRYISKLYDLIEQKYRIDFDILLIHYKPIDDANKDSRISYVCYGDASSPASDEQICLRAITS